MCMFVHLYTEYLREGIQETDPIVASGKQSCRAGGQGREGDCIRDFELFNFVTHVNKI